MGAMGFNKSVTTRTAEDGFDFLTRAATFESGNDIYNGTINTCDMGGCVKKFDKLNQTTIKKATKIVEAYEKEKGVAYYINCGIEKMELVTVENKRGNYKKPVYKEQYCLYVKGKQSYGGDTLIGDKDTLREAKKYAGDYALKEGISVSIRKERKLMEGETSVAEVVIKRREIKTEPKTLKVNQKIEKYYRFVFFGSAFY